MLEIFKTVIGWEGLYKSSNLGYVVSVRKGKRMIGSLRNGYRTIRLRKPGVMKSYSEHRLILEAFIGLNTDKPFVNHLNGVKTQKPVKLLEQLIEIFTDKGDVVIDPCAGSGTTLLAAVQCDRKAYGFEIKKDFFKLSKQKVLSRIQKKLF